MTRSELTSAYLLSADGTLAWIPYRLVQQGVVLTSATSDAAVLVLPVSAVEDPRYAPRLNQNGVYRVEDKSGTIARVGQGRVLDRVRRHRAKPVVVPHSVIAGVPNDGEWTVAERCYLEAKLADHWLSQGHALSSSTFIRDYPTLDFAKRKRMDVVLNQILRLIDAGKALVNGDDLFGFLPIETGESTALFSRESQWSRRFSPGTQLVYADCYIEARAVARRRDVVLLPDSLVRLSLSPTVGATFAKDFASFLTDARVIDLGGGIGRTRHPIAHATAAGLIKRTTGGRIHNADKWRPQLPHRPNGGSFENRG